MPLPPRDAQIRGSALVAGPLSSDGSVRIQTGSIPIVVETEPEMLEDDHDDSAEAAPQSASPLPTMTAVESAGDEAETVEDDTAEDETGATGAVEVDSAEADSAVAGERPTDLGEPDADEDMDDSEGGRS